MQASPVAFRKPPVDDVRIQLIGSNDGKDGPKTPEETERVLLGPVGVAKKGFTCNLYHKVFSNNLTNPCTILRWLINHLPVFILCVSIIEIAMSTQSSPEGRQNLNFDPDHKNQVYRFITYMLVHANVKHMAMNVLIQLFLGTPMELEQGHLRAAAIYIGGGLGGSLGSSVAEPHTVLEGASAGVYAILMAQISHIILNCPDLRYKRMRGAAVAVLLTADIAHATYHVSTWGNTQPRISIPAHVCGALAGIFLGLCIFKGTSRWTTIIKILSGTILVILYGSAIIHNVLKTHQLN